MTPPRPGFDQITLATPNGRHLCHDRQHRNTGRLAEVIVTFGQLGDIGKDPMWNEAWASPTRCAAKCWRTIEPIVRKHRPHLVLWGVHSRRYWAFPVFAARRGIIVSAADAGTLVERMRRTELAATRPPPPRQAPPPGCAPPAAKGEFLTPTTRTRHPAGPAKWASTGNHPAHARQRLPRPKEP